MFICRRFLAVYRKTTVLTRFRPFIYSIPAGQFELEELKYRNTAQQQNTVTNLNDLCFLNEPELLMTLRSRYQRNILSTYYGQVLLHFNPMRVSAEEDTHSEADEVLERFALDVRNHTGMAPGAWDAARKFVQSQTGSLGTCSYIRACVSTTLLL